MKRSMDGSVEVSGRHVSRYCIEDVPTTVRTRSGMNRVRIVLACRADLESIIVP